MPDGTLPCRRGTAACCSPRQLPCCSRRPSTRCSSQPPALLALPGEPKPACPSSQPAPGQRCCKLRSPCLACKVSWVPRHQGSPLHAPAGRHMCTSLPAWWQNCMQPLVPAACPMRQQALLKRTGRWWLEHPRSSVLQVPCPCRACHAGAAGPPAAAAAAAAASHAGTRHAKTLMRDAGRRMQDAGCSALACTSSGDRLCTGGLLAVSHPGIGFPLSCNPCPQAPWTWRSRCVWSMAWSLSQPQPGRQMWGLLLPRVMRR